MAVNSTLLSLLLKTKTDSNYKRVMQYNGPLAQSNPNYFIQFCDAIAKGVILGSPNIQFITKDTGFTGAPLKAGSGLGLGIKIDKNWFTRNLYSSIRERVIAHYGSTAHPEWCEDWDIQGNVPEDHCSLGTHQYNPYNFFTATCESISESISEHYEQFMVLTSSHPSIYSGAGKIEKGAFTGISAISVKDSIVANSALLKGDFWPIMVEEIAKVYTEAIMFHSTGEVMITGICIPTQSQLCSIIGFGVGSGLAS
jgi:hypothetical protein